GESAFEILIGRLEGTSKEQKNNNRIVKTNLVVRGTTK
ncbi:MAG TPA: LacI family transcriptional regulator, partial [Bacteroides graminisolvens]|nr:LacI family transcriptional regulator [Bacteroides graminisolvens]